MRTLRKIVVSALVMAPVLVVSVDAKAELTSNVAATSNYVWRGLTQTDGGAAVSGGIDYSSDTGIYLGTWASNTAFGSYELDLYAGFSKEFGSLGLDVGAIQYMYPEVDDNPLTPVDESDVDWTEFYIGLSYSNFSFKVSSSSDVWGSDTDGLYYELGADFEIAKDLGLGVHVGKSDFDENDPAAPSEDYTDYSISLSKGEFSFTLSDTNLDEVTYPADDDMKFTVTWAKDFSLLK